MTDNIPRDWRGTPITEGATVIYGAPVGRSITMVEAAVDGFTLSGRVWLYIVRRSFANYKDSERVHVGADRLTVVGSLPPSDVLTADELRTHRVVVAPLTDDGSAQVECKCGVRYTYDRSDPFTRYRAAQDARVKHIAEMREAGQ